MPSDEFENVPPEADYRIRRDAVSLAIESRARDSKDWDHVEGRTIRIEAYLRTGDFRTRR